MTQNDFYKLFAETGEPIYWLLSRCPTQPEASAARTEAPTPPDMPSTSAE